MPDQTYPADANGTVVNWHGVPLVLAGDDAPKFEAAGFDTIACSIYCSARVAAGTQTLPSHRIVRVAIDCNGQPVRDVAALAALRGSTARRATGRYNGADVPSATGLIWADDVVATHERLLRELPGFGCFAILIPR